MSQAGPRRGRLGPGFTPGHMTFLTAVSHTVTFKGLLPVGSESSFKLGRVCDSSVSR